jgi:hypothetical protein
MRSAPSPFCAKSHALRVICDCPHSHDRGAGKLALPAGSDDLKGAMAFGLDVRGDANNTLSMNLHGWSL